MAYPPPEVVQEAFIAPTSHIVRRCEIYENDGSTPWRAELWDRLIDGSVTADYTRDERRAMELTLDNFDGELQHSPTNLWYDKVFKIFYGITVNEPDHDPYIVIMEEFGSPGQAVRLKRMLNARGFTRVRINTVASTFAHIKDYDIVISISADYTRKLALLHEAFDSGKSVMTCNLQSTAAQLPRLIGSASATVVQLGAASYDTVEGGGASATVDIIDGGTASSVGPDSYNAGGAAEPGQGTDDPTAYNSIIPYTVSAHPLNAGWTQWTVTSSKSYRKILSLAAGVAQAGQWSDASNGLSPGVLALESPSGPRWVHLQQADFNPASMDNPEGCEAFIGSALEWIDTWEPTTYWETQIGEFMIDSLANDETGDTIAVSGRDYTTRCLLSKFVNSTGYAQGTNIGTIIRAIASNAGINKFNLPIITETLPRDLVYERNTERWKAMKEIADASNYELFFDSNGFMVMRKYQDPLLTPPTLQLTEGARGNLVSSSNKASAARLFNHVVVTGESSNRNFPPVAAEAKNILATSPSSIQRIGDRVTEIKSSLVTTTAQAQELANTYLRVSSLEEFELDFSAIMLPWIEPGEILEILEPVGGDFYPTRYLISNLNFPLDLGPMTGNGKRVTVVL